MNESLLAVASIVLPVFGMMAIGWLSARTGLLRPAVGDAIADFVFVIAVPVMLFRTLATAEIPTISPWPFWLAYFAGVAIAWSAATLVVRIVFGRDARAGVIGGVSSSFSNLVMVGLPFVVIAYGDDGAVPLMVLISIHLPIMMAAGSILVERAERLDTGRTSGAGPGNLALRIARSLATNPIIIGIAAGIAWRAAGLPLEGVPRSLADMMAAAAVPCALFSLGMGLNRYRFGGNIWPAFVTSGIKVLALPALVWLAATELTDLPPLWIAVATICAACPTGVNAWLIANRFGTGTALAANTITLSTLLSVATMGFWLILLNG